MPRDEFSTVIKDAALSSWLQQEGLENGESHTYYIGNERSRRIVVSLSGDDGVKVSFEGEYVSLLDSMDLSTQHPTDGEYKRWRSRND